MKTLWVTVGLIGMVVQTVSAEQAAREITIETKKIGEAVHWVPEKVEVQPGETVKMTVKHELEGGFDFHGLHIPRLRIQKQVDRHKPVTFEVKIPKNLKPGEHKISCHFHEKHVPATLVVRAPTTALKK